MTVLRSHSAKARSVPIGVKSFTTGDWRERRTFAEWDAYVVSLDETLTALRLAGASEDSRVSISKDGWVEARWDEPSPPENADTREPGTTQPREGGNP